ncbi:MAG: rRNA maturation RNase YbeY [Candidatus Gracilibacteria bacterium]|nr:rRNA maturation RNase YbeY [Candidatus Gracilibacteria bacterium]
MFKYEITPVPEIKIDKKIVDKIFKTVSKNIEKTQKGTLNIVFLDDESIKNLNKNYRNIDKTTDVLSFHYFDDFSLLKNTDTAGEIVMSIEKIITQGKDYGLGTEKEFYKLLIHSILHIIGYDHELDDEYKIMQKLEDTIWKELFEN